MMGKQSGQIQMVTLDIDSIQFFQTVQNKMHWAVHRHSATELIVERANAEKEHMGLTTWESAPNGKIVKETIHAKGIDIGIYTTNFGNEFILLTDIANYRNEDDLRFVFLYKRQSRKNVPKKIVQNNIMLLILQGHKSY